MWATLYFNMWNVTSCIIEMLDDLPKLKNLKISSTWGELGLMTAGVYVQYGVAKVPKMERSYMQRVSIIYLFRMPVYKIRQPRGQCLFLRADMLPADPAGWLKIVNQLLPNNAIFFFFFNFLRQVFYQYSNILHYCMSRKDLWGLYKWLFTWLLI